MTSGMVRSVIFFDHHFLNQFSLTHEHIGQMIIREHVGPIIKRLTRSPSGPFATGEQLDPEHIAFLILKDPSKKSRGFPRWLTFLQPIIGGVYTADNCDYVLRDSYMCGVAVGPIDIERLLRYTFLTPKGLTIQSSRSPSPSNVFECPALPVFECVLSSNDESDRHSSSRNFSGNDEISLSIKPAESHGSVSDAHTIGLSLNRFGNGRNIKTEAKDG